MPILTEAEFINVLRETAASLVQANNTMVAIKANWDKTAVGCKFCHTGFFEQNPSTLECSHGQMVYDDDPFCYSANCPLIK